jgi:hypothetical protein
MKTFKQFLEEYDVLGSMPIELVFRQLGLSKGEAESAARWWEGDIPATEVSSDAWDLLFEPVLGQVETDAEWDDEVEAVIQHLKPIMRKNGITHGNPIS